MISAGRRRTPGPSEISAVMFADKVTTPLLILHGRTHPRTMLQGLEFYALLAERGKTVRMVTYRARRISRSCGNSASIFSGDHRLAGRIQPISPG